MAKDNTPETFTAATRKLSADFFGILVGLPMGNRTFAAYSSNQKTMLSILLFFGNLGAGEIFLILAVVILLFGAKKIPELARGMGRGIREFKDATKDIKDTIDEESKKA